MPKYCKNTLKIILLQNQETRRKAVLESSLECIYVDRQSKLSHGAILYFCRLGSRSGRAIWDCAAPPSWSIFLIQFNEVFIFQPRQLPKVPQAHVRGFGFSDCKPNFHIYIAQKRPLFRPDPGTFFSGFRPYFVQTSCTRYYLQVDWSDQLAKLSYVSYVGNVWSGSLASIDVFRYVGRCLVLSPGM